MAARSCAWEPEAGGGAGGTAVLSGVELSEVFAVSPKRSAGNATLEALARAFVKPKPRRRKNVALVAWGDGNGGEASYLVGALTTVQILSTTVPGLKSKKMLIRIARERAQVLAERLPAGTAAGGAFSGQRCTLFFDPTYWHGTYWPRGINGFVPIPNPPPIPN